MDKYCKKKCTTEIQRKYINDEKSVIKMILSPTSSVFDKF